MDAGRITRQHTVPTARIRRKIRSKIAAIREGRGKLRGSTQQGLVMCLGEDKRHDTTRRETNTVTELPTRGTRGTGVEKSLEIRDKDDGREGEAKQVDDERRGPLRRTARKHATHGDAHLPHYQHLGPPESGASCRPGQGGGPNLSLKGLQISNSRVESDHRVMRYRWCLSSCRVDMLHC